MANQRLPIHTAPRVSERALPAQADRSRLGGSVRCAVRDCIFGRDAAGVLCESHWFALPWALRNDAGPAHQPPAKASQAWLRSALDVLQPRASIRAKLQLSQSERRFRPVALRILQEHEPRPETRAECLNRGRMRPCPYVSCERHLYMDVTESGTLKLNFPGKEVWELEETCADDVAELGGVSAKRAGELVGLKKGRVDQMARALRAAAAEFDPG